MRGSQSLQELGYRCYDGFLDYQEYSRVRLIQTAIDFVPGFKRHTRSTKLRRTTFRRSTLPHRSQFRLLLASFEASNRLAC